MKTKNLNVWWSGIVIAVSFAALACLRPLSAPDTVLLLSIDTLRADRLGLYGAREAATPVIDALGRESIVFDAAVSPAPLTLPAHASMLTGLYPPRHGVRANGVHRLGADIPLLTESFRAAGFRTGAFIGGYPLERRFGLARGFDHYDDELSPNAKGFHYPERRGGLVVERTLRWVAQQSPGQKVLLFIHLYDPHADYAPPPPFDGRFAARPYDGEVAYTDSAVGELRRGLGSLGRWKDAVLLVVADHGESLGEHGEETHGLLLYEPVLRVPFLVKAPGLVPERVQEPVSLVDVAPTLLALAGLPPLASIDGVDLAMRRRGRRDIYAETLGPFLDHGWSGLRALRRGQLKLVEAPFPELFDLAADPGEARNLWPSAEGERLRAALVSAVSGMRPAEAERARLDRSAREMLASLGYAASAADVPADFGLDRPDPKTRMDVVRALDALVALAETSPASALRTLVVLSRRDPGNNLIWRRIAALRMRTGDPEGAIPAYREAGRLGYRGEDLAGALGEAYLRAAESRAEKGGLAPAKRLLEEAARLQPRRAEIRHAMGVVEARAGRLEAALAALREATDLDPRFAPAWFSTGLAEERRGRPAEAAEAYRRFLNLAPEDSPEARHARAFLRSRS